MGKQKSKVKIRIPSYLAPRIEWRRAIHSAIALACEEYSVSYRASDRLELKVILYLKDMQLSLNDLDNRLKDIMDALQGRAGGSKSKPTLRPIIPNDRQIYRVVIEKKKPPKQSRGLGHVTIRQYADNH